MFKFNFEGDRQPSFFDPFELFKDQTSIEILELSTKIIAVVIELIKSKPNYYELYHSVTLFFSELLVNNFNVRKTVKII
jgi:hypothetical protein